MQASRTIILIYILHIVLYPDSASTSRDIAAFEIQTLNVQGNEIPSRSLSVHSQDIKFLMFYFVISLFSCIQYPVTLTVND